jgi:hypothetical protein
MANATFDTHRLIGRLQKAGVDQAAAEAISDALKEVYGETDLVTKKDLEIALSPIKTDIAVLKWMIGVVIAGIATLILKAFFLA